MALAAADIKAIKTKIKAIPNTTTQTALEAVVDALAAVVPAEGATGSVTAGSSSEALTVVDGVITAIG